MGRSTWATWTLSRSSNRTIQSRGQGHLAPLVGDLMITVEMRGITKRFPGVVANDAVDLVLRAGEVHGLLGENGAGKTTLMNILFGLYQPDEGQILVKDQPVTIHSPADAIGLGIGMVHQHFKLVQPFTVTENIVLGLGRALRHGRGRTAGGRSRGAVRPGHRSGRAGVVGRGAATRRDPQQPVSRRRRRSSTSRPPSTPQETSADRRPRGMAEKGKTIVFISHKLKKR